MSLPTPDRTGLVLFGVSAALVAIGLVIPFSPARIFILLIVFSIYVGWMAYVLKDWAFESWE